MSLEQRFATLLSQAGIFDIRSNGTVWETLAAHYSEPHRHYHNLAHIDSMLDLLMSLEAGEPALELAIWFHDVIYDPKATDNEERSARFFQTSLGHALHPALAADVVRLILATQHSAPRTGLADEDLIRDIDLSILAAPPETYRTYAAAIRKEYAHVPDEAFSKGRAAVLNHFLASPVFTTPAFIGKEQAARSNLGSELVSLAL